MTHEKGVKPTLYAPSRTGYEFKGWFLDSKFTKTADSFNPSKGVKVTYYAKWEAKSYKVTFVANGGALVGDNSVTITYGKKYPKLATKATRNGYKFAGWFTQPTGGKKVTPSTVFKPADPNGVKLYAHWTPVTYKIKYQLAGGKAGKNAPKTYKANKNCVIPAPTKKGYTFVRWDVVEAKGKVAVSSGSILADKGNYGDVTLKAVWTENVYDIVVHFNDPKNPGSDVTTKHRFKYSDKVHIFSLAYSFPNYQPQYGQAGGKFIDSLNSKKDGKGTKYLLSKDYYRLSTGSSPSSKEVKTLHMYLQWGSTIYYEIGYMLDGGTMKDPVHAYSGKTEVKIPNPTKKGYKFTGWTVKYLEGVGDVKTVKKSGVTYIKKGSHGDVYFIANWTPVKKK